MDVEFLNVLKEHLGDASATVLLLIFFVYSKGNKLLKRFENVETELQQIKVSVARLENKDD